MSQQKDQTGFIDRDQFDCQFAEKNKLIDKLTGDLANPFAAEVCYHFLTTNLILFSFNAADERSTNK